MNDSLNLQISNTAIKEAIDSQDNFKYQIPAVMMFSFDKSPGRETCCYLHTTCIIQNLTDGNFGLKFHYFLLIILPSDQDFRFYDILAIASSLRIHLSWGNQSKYSCLSKERDAMIFFWTAASTKMAAKWSLVKSHLMVMWPWDFIALISINMLKHVITCFCQKLKKIIKLSHLHIFQYSHQDLLQVFLSDQHEINFHLAIRFFMSLNFTHQIPFGQLDCVRINLHELELQYRNHVLTCFTMIKLVITKKWVFVMV